MGERGRGASYRSPSLLSAFDDELLEVSAACSWLILYCLPPYLSYRFPCAEN
jgi:hypothetical protein